MGLTFSRARARVDKAEVELREAINEATDLLNRFNSTPQKRKFEDFGALLTNSLFIPLFHMSFIETDNRRAVTEMRETLQTEVAKLSSEIEDFVKVGSASSSININTDSN